MGGRPSGSMRRGGKLLTVTEAAERVAISKSKIRRLLREKKLKGVRVAGTSVRIPEREVDKLVTPYAVE